MIILTEFMLLSTPYIISWLFQVYLFCVLMQARMFQNTKHVTFQDNNYVIKCLFLKRQESANLCTKKVKEMLSLPFLTTAFVLQL